MALPALLPVKSTKDWEQSSRKASHRNFLIREMAAKTVFTMLYVGALHGTGCWLRPDQVTRMTDHQSATTGEEDACMARGSLRPRLVQSGKVVRGQYARTDPGRDFARRAGTNGSRARTQGFAHYIAPATICAGSRVRGFVRSGVGRTSVTSNDHCMARRQPFHGRAGAHCDIAPGYGCRRGTSARHISERRNPAHGAGPEFRNIQSCRGGIRASVSQESWGNPVEREPQQGSGARRRTGAGHRSGNSAGPEPARPDRWSTWDQPNR